jgi:hypothetical protein
VVAQLASYAKISPVGTNLRVQSLGDQPNDWVSHEVLVSQSQPSVLYSQTAQDDIRAGNES